MIVRRVAHRSPRRTGFHIAQTTGLSLATVSRILPRLRLNRMRNLEPVPLDSL